MRLSTNMYMAHGPGRTIATSGVLLNADKDTMINVDTALGQIVLTLPGAPIINDTFYLLDKSGTWPVNNVVLATNKFFGTIDTYVIDLSGGLVTVQWRGEFIGWTVAFDAPMIDNSTLSQLFAARATADSPAFTGIPTTPTGVQLQNTPQIASQTYVNTAVLTEKTRAQGVEATLAPLNNPVFAGAPTVPIAASNDSTLKIANTSWTTARINELKTRLAADWQPTVLTTNSSLATSAAGTIIGVNSSNGAFSVTMPATPTIGDTYTFVDVNTSWESNPVTLVLQNKYHGAVTDLSLDVSNSCVSLKFTGTTYGWIQIN